MKAGKLTAAIGASRSGKSQFVQSETAKARRLLVWDVKGEYGAVSYRPQTRAELVQCLKHCAGKPGRIAFVPPDLGDFAFFCRAAAVWIKSHYAARQPCALIFEETADVTSPGKAPAEYGILLRRYLAYGVDIFAVTQRPAESDKTSIGNASRVHICRAATARDRRSVAGDTGVPLAAIEGLRADQDAGQFDYIAADTGRGFWSPGVLTFPNGRARFKTATEKHAI